MDSLPDRTNSVIKNNDNHDYLLDLGYDDVYKNFLIDEKTTTKFRLGSTCRE